MSEYASVCLNIPEYAWECLNNVLAKTGFSICLIILDIWQGFEYVAGIKYVMVLIMLQYNYNNIIIIVTNIIMLEFYRLILHIQVLCSKPFFLFLASV